jgi:hypothetical protein
MIKTMLSNSGRETISFSSTTFFMSNKMAGDHPTLLSDQQSIHLTFSLDSTQRKTNKIMGLLMNSKEKKSQRKM